MAHEVSFVAGADLFTRNLHFVGSYWDEHRINVRDLFSKVISVVDVQRANQVDTYRLQQKFIINRTTCVTIPYMLYEHKNRAVNVLKQ
jgi:hypothetical protein